jgi:hypothetical protein
MKKRRYRRRSGGNWEKNKKPTTRAEVPRRTYLISLLPPQRRHPLRACPQTARDIVRVDGVRWVFAWGPPRKRKRKRERASFDKKDKNMQKIEGETGNEAVVGRRRMR